jgi:5-methylcytosine-specific restriction enzyme A
VPPPPKQRDDIYASPQFLDWRKAVIARAGHMCQRCGRAGVRLFADHIVELKDGGELLNMANGWALCGSCHTTKTHQERVKRHELALE